MTVEDHRRAQAVGGVAAGDPADDVWPPANPLGTQGAANLRLPPGQRAGVGFPRLDPAPEPLEFRGDELLKRTLAAAVFDRGGHTGDSNTGAQPLDGLVGDAGDRASNDVGVGWWHAD